MTRRRDATAYVLNGLPPDEEARLRRRERDDPSFAAEVRRLRAVTGRLSGLDATAWEPATPPPLRAPAPADSAAPAPTRSRRPARRRLVLRPLPAALAACALLAAGAVGGALVPGGRDDAARTTPATGAGAGARIALGPIDQGPPGANAQATLRAGGARRMSLTVAGLEPTAAGAFYEVWLLRSPTELVSIGTFRVDDRGRARVSFPVGVDPSRFPIVDVSREPADGDPRHSSVSVLRSRA
jgi:anti-sigma-K factor RskA